VVSDLRGEKLHKSFVTGVLRAALGEIQGEAARCDAAPRPGVPPPAHEIRVHPELADPDGLAAMVELRLFANVHDPYGRVMGRSARIRSGYGLNPPRNFSIKG
jgi:hypothetical protein